MSLLKMLIVTFTVVVIGCAFKTVDDSDRIRIVAQYFDHHQINSPQKWQYTTDTIRQWFDEKTGTPTLIIKDKPSTGKWKEWDEEMHASSGYDSLWYDAIEGVVKGHFYENNDFYQLIGKPATTTLRTFWMNEQGKIAEILIYWIPTENKTTSVYLEPIVAWAKQHAPEEIATLYPDGKLIPSRENAKRWKLLLARYNNEIHPKK